MTDCEKPDAEQYMGRTWWAHVVYTASWCVMLYTQAMCTSNDIMNHKDCVWRPWYFHNKLRLVVGVISAMVEKNWGKETSALTLFDSWRQQTSKQISCLELTSAIANACTAITLFIIFSAELLYSTAWFSIWLIRWLVNNVYKSFHYKSIVKDNVK